MMDRMYKGLLWCFIFKALSDTAAGGVFFYHADHLGFPQVATNEFGSVLEVNTYAAFGEKSQGESRYSFAGNERDMEAGFDYLGARYYDPSLCRFASVDPIQQMVGSASNTTAQTLQDTLLQEPHRWNNYSYAGNDPVNSIDYNGLFQAKWQGRQFNEPVRKIIDYQEANVSSVIRGQVPSTSVSLGRHVEEYLALKVDPPVMELLNKGQISFTSSGPQSATALLVGDLAKLKETYQGGVEGNALKFDAEITGLLGHIVNYFDLETFRVDIEQRRFTAGKELEILVQISGWTSEGKLGPIPLGTRPITDLYVSISGDPEGGYQGVVYVLRPEDISSRNQDLLRKIHRGRDPWGFFRRNSGIAFQDKGLIEIKIDTR